MRDYNFYVLIMSNKSHTLYVGVTSDLDGRVWEHKSGALGGFTARYRFTRLVWFERHTDIRQAIAREKQIKGWRRQKKVALIQSLNPVWADLVTSIKRYPHWFDTHFRD